MKQPELCVFCKETEFEFHEEIELYNPDTDQPEILKEVYQCKVCKAYHFETDEYICAQKNINEIIEHTPELASYMKS